MPKQMQVERFKLSCEVEAGHLGPTLATLTKMGLTNLGFELITDVRTFRKNKDKGSTGELLAAWVKDHPTFKAIEAVRMFEANGHTRGSAYPALGVLVEQGILKSLGQGNYARADVKQPTAPARKKRVAKAAPKQFDKPADAVILGYAKRNHGRFNTAKLTEIFEDQGRAKNSLSACIAKLIKRKQIKRVGDPGSGSYVLLQKAAKKVKPPKAVNGSAVEVTANV